MKRYAYAWINLGFFAVSIGLHWLFGWLTFVDEAREHGQAPEPTSYLMMMARDTFENWQSEFLQLLWQVVELAYFLYVGSPASKENDDRMEARIDALLELVGHDRGQQLIEAIDKTQMRRDGHAMIHIDPPYERTA